MVAPAKKQAKTISLPQEKRLTAIFSFSYRTKAIILCCIAFLFYANTIFNKYALDDDLTIVSNAYVQMGLKGIPKILTNDSYASYYAYMGINAKKRLSGGRYRPLSEIVFAIEQQLFSNSDLLTYFRHFVNILAYMACVLSLFYFLDKFLFKKISWGSDVAFLAALLFTIHPLHTEVVANIKSLDEILSLLFIILTLIYSLKYLESKQIKHLAFGAGAYLLALLSKEYATLLLFFIPFLYYLLENKKPATAIKIVIPYLGIFLIYLLMRYNAVGFHGGVQTSNVLANPYYYATSAQKVATECFVLGKYLGLLFFPYPLSCDYSYYQITYHNFSNITVLFSILVYTGIFIWGVILLRNKNVLSFAMFFFLFTILIISNFVVDIGATMAERLVFHASLGFVIILSYYLIKAVAKMPLQAKRNIIVGIMSVVGAVCFGETVIRNAEWKDNISLYTHDVEVVPNSAWMNNNAGWDYLSLSERKENTIEQAKAYLDSAKKCLLRSLHFNPQGDFTYSNLGKVYFDEGLLDSAQYCYDMLGKLHPNFPDLNSKYLSLSRGYFAKGLEAHKSGNPRLTITYMKKALMDDSNNADIWYNMGVAYNSIQQYDSERYVFMKTLRYKPDSLDAAGTETYLQKLEQMK